MVLGEISCASLILLFLNIWKSKSDSRDESRGIRRVIIQFANGASNRRDCN